MRKVVLAMIKKTEEDIMQTVLIEPYLYLSKGMLHRIFLNPYLNTSRFCYKADCPFIR